jgi:hypothetical protein
MDGKTGALLLLVSISDGEIAKVRVSEQNNKINRNLKQFFFDSIVIHYRQTDLKS